MSAADPYVTIRLALRGAVLPVAVAAAALGLFASQARANTVYTVSGFADSTAPCNGSVCPSLRAAVVAANALPGSTIQLAAGTYLLGGGPGVRVGSGDLMIRAAITIQGVGDLHTRIEQTDGRDRVLTITGGQTVLRTLSISGGRSAGADAVAGAPGVGGTGGGIFVAPPAALTATDVTISGNAAAGGSGGAQTAGAGAGGAGGPAAGGGITNFGYLVLDGTYVEHNTVTGGSGGDGSTGGTGGDAAGAAIENYGTLVAQDGVRILANGSFGGAGGIGSAGAGAGGAGGHALGAIDGEAGGSIALSGTSLAFDHAVGGNGGAGSAPVGGVRGARGIGGAGGAGYGGAVSVTGSSVTLEADSLNDDAAEGGLAGGGGTGGVAGGGAVFDGGTAVIVNSTVTANIVVARAGGDGLGGGIDAPATAALTLASVTLDANSVDGPGAGGNLDASSGSTADTIIAGGSARSGSNCAAAVGVDGGHNLEDDSAGQCGLAQARGDIVADPLLEPRAVNSGQAETMALAPGSPAIRTGGRCLDPTTTPPDGPLTVDERGEPRGPVCDIGAFQSEPPQLTVAPQLFGIAKVGTTLTCSHGIWIGDGTLAYEYRWLGDGVSIATGPSDTLGLARADAGKRLVCEVRAINLYGQASAASRPFKMVAVPRLRHVRQSHRRWHRGSKRARISGAGGPPVGTTFRFQLNERATVTFTFYRARRGNGRRTSIATLKFSARAGASRVYFDGRLKHHRELAAGRYVMGIYATAGGMRSRRTELSFTALSR